MWQALLLSQTQLTQGLGHLATSPSLTMRVADVLVNFLPPPLLPRNNPSPTKSGPRTHGSASSPVKRNQVSSAPGFALVLKLWGVVKNVLASSCLSSISERIFDAVLAKEYSLSEDEKLQGAWWGLCSDLVASCFTHAVALVLRPPSSSNSSNNPESAPAGANMRREVWRMVSRSWPSASVGVGWETGIQLLITSRR